MSILFAKATSRHFIFIYTISELLSQADGEEETPLCRKYREELEQLRDEFERYRLRAQSVLKNKKVRPVYHRDVIKIVDNSQKD